MTDLMYVARAVQSMSNEKLEEFMRFVAENDLSADPEALKQEILLIRGEQDVNNAESI